MKRTIDRRRFLKRSALAALAAGAGPGILQAADLPSKRLSVAVMGLGRGLDHAKALLQIPNARIAALAEVEEGRLAAGMKLVNSKQDAPARAVKDFRTILEDREVDALFIAGPNFWHAPAAILACAAGKHVYVEKPGSHNARESEWLVQAAAKHQRVVQMGIQRRSWPGMIEAVDKLRSGVIGRLAFARAFYSNTRGSIGTGRPAPVPAGLDYALWQGPAPERPYLDNLIPYQWHWRWHWGGGELANNGVHMLDLVRWGLGVNLPRRVSCTGGRYHFKDDQETPDTALTVFDFGGCGASFDHSSCAPRKTEEAPLAVFYGEGGSLALSGTGYKVFDRKGAQTGQGTGEGGDKGHFENFLGCIRAGGRPSADIADGQKSAMLCHLGNIAYRLGRTLETDPATGKITGCPEAAALWGREYRPGWTPRV